jgi:predicted XRE-type DNA-binding protein
MITKEWQHQVIALANTNTISWRGIAEMVGKPRSTVSDFLRKYYKEISEDKADDMFSQICYPVDEETISLVEDVQSKVHDNSRILFISDIHIPYHHKNLIPFLKMLKERYNPTRVICLGDETDKHALSFHDSDPDLMSAGDELRAALPVIQELHELFPEMDLIDSNHGSMVWRKAKHHGIPRHYIKSYNEVLNVGKGWVWHNDLVLDLPDGQQVYVHHGKTKDALKVSQSMGMSFCCGHFHEDFSIKYWANPNGLFFAMNSGCLIDDESYAFAYNNVNLNRPIIGTSLIIDGVPVLEAMPL